MKKSVLSFFIFLFLLAVVPSSFAFSELNVLRGDFVVTEVYSIESHRRFEKVDSASVDGQERLKLLLLEKYNCALESEEGVLYICSKFLNDLNDYPVALDEQVRSRWGGYLVSVREPVDEPKMVYNSEIYKSWEVEQKVLVNRSSADPIIYTRTSYTVTQGIWRFILQGPQASTADSFYFLIKNTESLALSGLVTIDGKNVSDQYSVTVFTQKVQ